jgi:hypothetical protein
MKVDRLSWRGCVICTGIPPIIWHSTQLYLSLLFIELMHYNTDTHDGNGDIPDRITDSDMEWMSSNRTEGPSDHFSSINGAANNVHTEDRWSQLEARKG